MGIETDFISAVEAAIHKAHADIDAAAAGARARAMDLAGDARTEVVTLFPVSLLWAHKGLLVLVGAALVLAAALGHWLG